MVVCGGRRVGRTAVKAHEPGVVIEATDDRVLVHERHLGLAGCTGTGAQEVPDVLQAQGSVRSGGRQRLGARGVDVGRAVRACQTVQAHDRAQRFGTAPFH
jgi:hypothetical protein